MKTNMQLKKLSKKRIIYLCIFLLAIIAFNLYMMVDFNSALLVLYVIKDTLLINLSIFIFFTVLYLIGSTINIVAQHYMQKDYFNEK